MKQVFVIKSHEQITKVIAYMHSNYTQALNEGKPLRVVIDQKQEERTKAQNSLLHMWFDEIAKFTGDDPKSTKYEMKKKFLARICIRDSEDALDAYEAVLGYRDVIKRFDEQERLIHTVKYNRLVKMFIEDHVKSSKLNKKQFTEFCDKIHRFANVTLGVYLTVPDDLKYLRSE